MALTRDFKETMKKRIESNPEFSKALLNESVELMLNGDSATAKLLLRDLINATIGFERLAQEVHKPSKSIHRMLSASGNPTMENLSAIFATMKKTLSVGDNPEMLTALDVEAKSTSTPITGSLRGLLRDARPDEKDYQKYLEEKHL